MGRGPKVTIRKKATVVAARLTGASIGGSALIARTSKDTAKRVWHDPALRNLFREIKADFQPQLAELYGRMLDSIAIELDQAMRAADWIRVRELRSEILRVVAAGESVPQGTAAGQGGSAGQTLDAILRTYATEITISGSTPANGAIIDAPHSPN